MRVGHDELFFLHSSSPSLDSDELSFQKFRRPDANSLNVREQEEIKEAWCFAAKVSAASDELVFENS
jgi:hypothetical protein